MSSEAAGDSRVENSFANREKVEAEAEASVFAACLVLSAALTKIHHGNDDV